MKLSLIIITLFLFITALPADALIITNGKNITIMKTQNDDTYIFGQFVELSGTCNNDITVAAMEINANRSIQGDACFIGGIINIRGQIHDDLQAFGGRVDIKPNAVVRGHTIIAAGEVILDNGVVIGDGCRIIADTLRIPHGATVFCTDGLYFSGGTLIIDGEVNGDITVAMKPNAESPAIPKQTLRSLITGNTLPKVHLNGIINGSLYITAHAFELTPNARITHNLYYSVPKIVRHILLSPEKLNRAVHGTHHYYHSPIRTLTQCTVYTHALHALWIFISLLILGIGVIFSFCGILKKAQKILIKKTVYVSWIGTALFFGVPILIALCISFAWISGVLLIIAGALTFLFLLSLCIGIVVLAAALGFRILKPAKNNARTLISSIALGLIIFSGLRMIPYIGIPLMMFAVLPGLGALITTLYQHRPH